MRTALNFSVFVLGTGVTQVGEATAWGFCVYIRVLRTKSLPSLSSFLPVCLGSNRG